MFILMNGCSKRLNLVKESLWGKKSATEKNRELINAQEIECTIILMYLTGVHFEMIGAVYFM